MVEHDVPCLGLAGWSYIPGRQALGSKNISEAKNTVFSPVLVTIPTSVWYFFSLFCLFWLCHWCGSAVQILPAFVRMGQPTFQDSPREKEVFTYDKPNMLFHTPTRRQRSALDLNFQLALLPKWRWSQNVSVLLQLLHVKQIITAPITGCRWERLYRSLGTMIRLGTRQQVPTCYFFQLTLHVLRMCWCCFQKVWSLLGNPWQIVALRCSLSMDRRIRILEWVAHLPLGDSSNPTINLTHLLIVSCIYVV